MESWSVEDVSSANYQQENRVEKANEVHYRQQAEDSHQKELHQDITHIATDRRLLVVVHQEDASIMDTRTRITKIISTWIPENITITADIRENINHGLEVVALVRQFMVAHRADRVHLKTTMVNTCAPEVVRHRLNRQDQIQDIVKREMFPFYEVVTVCVCVCRSVLEMICNIPN